MKDQLLVAQRIVCEGLMKEGGPIKVDMNNVVMKSVKQSTRCCKGALEENKQKQTQGEKNEKKENQLQKK